LFPSYIFSVGDVVWLEEDGNPTQLHVATIVDKEDDGLLQIQYHKLARNQGVTTIPAQLVYGFLEEGDKRKRKRKRTCK
jgi:hypothetical protein